MSFLKDVKTTTLPRPEINETPNNSKYFSFQYPKNPTNDIVEFTFKDTYGHFNDDKNSIIGTIILYQTGNLKADYTQQWDDGEKIFGTHGSATDIKKNWGALLIDGTADLVKSSILGVADSSMLSKSNSVRAGKSVNPFKGVTYTAAGMRSIEFDYSFVPTTEDEVKEVMEIIMAFKYYSSPDYGGIDKDMVDSMKKKVDALNKKNGDKANLKNTIKETAEFATNFALNYPCQFDISFKRLKDNNSWEENTTLSKFGPAVLTGLSINYSVGDLWRTFRNGFPVEVTMGISFKETKMLTKSDIEKGY
jgi:hypothetical protein